MRLGIGERKKRKTGAGCRWDGLERDVPATGVVWRARVRWAVGSGQRAVGGGQWAVGSGQWAVGSGQWAVGGGKRAVGRGKRTDRMSSRRTGTASPSNGAAHSSNPPSKIQNFALSSARSASPRFDENHPPPKIQNLPSPISPLRFLRDLRGFAVQKSPIPDPRS